MKNIKFWCLLLMMSYTFFNKKNFLTGGPFSMRVSVDTYLGKPQLQTTLACEHRFNGDLILWPFCNIYRNFDYEA